MKKLMLILTVLMIAGSVSAHGFGYYHGYGWHVGVVVPRPYIAPYVVVRPPLPYYGYYGPYFHGYGGYYHGYGGCRGGYRGYRR